MDKPILATNIDGLLLNHKVFSEPHRYWFERAIKKTKDNSLKRWMDREDYFIGVNEAMQKIMPHDSQEKRTYQARKWYQQDVIKYIKNHPEEIKKDIAEKLISLREKYKIILITTNTEKYINKILKKAKLNRIYEGIIASKTEKEPSKEELVDELINRYGKPEYYLTGKPEEKITKKLEEMKVKVLGIDKISRL